MELTVNHNDVIDNLAEEIKVLSKEKAILNAVIKQLQEDNAKLQQQIDNDEPTQNNE